LRRLLRKPGWHGDGDGLYFRAEGSDRAYWIYRYTGQGGKRRVISLGPYPEVGLADARAKHAELRARVLADKADPLAENRAAKEAERRTPTFGEVADEHLRAPKLAQERPPPTAMVRRAHDILRADPRHTGRSGRIEAVLSAAQALGHIAPDRANPARWRGHLDHLLPKQDKARHHAAMPYRDVPAFMDKLEATPGAAAAALRFAILCASRSGEVFGTMVKRRRKVMADWAMFLAGESADVTVVPFTATARR
jgi:hypothetical protein